MTRVRRFLALEAPALLVLTLPFLAELATSRALPEAARAGLWSALGIYALLLLFPFVDPFRNVRWDAKPLPQLRLGLVVSLVGFALLQARALFDGDAEDERHWMLLGAIAVLAVVGNAMPAVPRNLFVGIRVPWTLRDPVVWARTHRLAGRLMVGSAVGLALLYPALHPSTVAPAILVGSLAPLFAAAVYSWYVSRAT